MKETVCPYKKISEKEAGEIALYSDDNFLTNFSLVPKAEAQSVNAQSTQLPNSSLSGQLTLPFYLLVISFFIFVGLMSFVYYYHWKKFTLNDSFIARFLPIYFLGLLMLSIPLLYNLFL